MVGVQALIGSVRAVAFTLLGSPQFPRWIYYASTAITKLLLVQFTYCTVNVVFNYCTGGMLLLISVDTII